MSARLLSQRAKIGSKRRWDLVADLRLEEATTQIRSGRLKSRKAVFQRQSGRRESRGRRSEQWWINCPLMLVPGGAS